MRRAFYAMQRRHQSAFRAAVTAVRDSDAGTTRAEGAFLALDIGRHAVERTHTLCLYERVADLLAVTPEADRGAIESALFGEAHP